MTTIAYRDGILATDTRCMAEGWKLPHRARKLFPMKDGSVCAITGGQAITTRYVDWLDGDQSETAPNLGMDSRVIQLSPCGKLTIYEMTGSFEVEGEFGAFGSSGGPCEFTAFGSGAPPAIAAMYMGADAKKAVEIAAMVDEMTGGEIVTMSCVTKTPNQAGARR